LNPQTPGIAQRFVDLPRDPEAMKQHGEFSGHRHHCPLFGILATTLCDLLSVASEVGVRGERAQDVVALLTNNLLSSSSPSPEIRF
jgi:hypothetical protein